MNSSSNYFKKYPLLVEPHILDSLQGDLGWGTMVVMKTGATLGLRHCTQCLKGIYPPLHKQNISKLSKFILKIIG